MRAMKRTYITSNKLAAFLLCASAASCCANSVIDTVSAWNGTTVAYFGLPNTATYGQTITAPFSDPLLTSFSFELDLPATDTFKAYVFAWNGTSATGSPLYTSPVTSTLGTGFQLFTINTGPVPLAPGGSYVLFVSATEVPTSSGVGYAGIRLDTDAYSGGNFVFLNNGTDSSQWTTTPWSTVFAS